MAIPQPGGEEFSIGWTVFLHVLESSVRPETETDKNSDHFSKVHLDKRVVFWRRVGGWRGLRWCRGPLDVRLLRLRSRGNLR
jgi:hypothetical protein